MHTVIDGNIISGLCILLGHLSVLLSQLVKWARNDWRSNENAIHFLAIFGGNSSISQQSNTIGVTNQGERERRDVNTSLDIDSMS